MFNFLSFLMSLIHSIPFRHAIHFLTCITLDLISLSSVPLVSKIIPKYLHSWQNSISLSSSNFKFLCVPPVYKYFVLFKFKTRPQCVIHLHLIGFCRLCKIKWFQRCKVSTFKLAATRSCYSTNSLSHITVHVPVYVTAYYFTCYCVLLHV
jgi:hypothetical protein